MTSRVLLLNLPFSSLRWPALGISLLQAGLRRDGIDCDLAYFNFDLAETVGLETYEWINDSLGFVLGGERLFAKNLFGASLPSEHEYTAEVLLAADPGFPVQDMRAFEHVGTLLDAFLDGCLKQIDWSRYAVVGFTTTFQQTMASLALAARIKERHPAITVCLGGANCEGEMGQAVLDRFPQIDVVFSGEGDETFPLFVKEHFAGRPIPRCPGILTRVGTSVEGQTAACVADLGPVQDLDRLPYPEFGDYFKRLGQSPLRDRIDPLLLFESARGCWWGAKSQCTFCGLNGGAIAFRSKSARRVIDELRHLRDTYGVRRACATDNILDFRYFRSMLPLLAEADLDLELEYELKTNLTRPQVELMRSAGIRAAQLGIESLSTPILRSMRKGITASQNIQTLKWLTAAGMEVKWNFLYGFPGEDPAAYAELPDLIPKLVHLAPPQAVGRVRIDRFSPYFESPKAFGLSALKPISAYRHVFPYRDEDLARLAYYFDLEGHNQRDETPEHLRPTLAALEDWRALAGAATLRGHEHPGGVLVLLDTRPVATSFEYRLRGWARIVYAYCDTARPLSKIVELARAEDDSVEEPEVRRTLHEWIETGLMIYLDGSYLSLALIE